MERDTQKKRFKGFDARVLQIQVGVVAALFILIARLWQLQIVDGEKYEKAADENRLHPVRLGAPRGMIFGRDNVVLADNRGAWDLVYVPGGNDSEELVRRLESIVTIDGKVVLEEVERNKKQPYKQITLKQDLSKSELTRIEEYSHMLPGVITIVRPKRRYAQGKTAGQIIGYIGEIGPKELKERQANYMMGDIIGKDGIESVYENELRGKDGRMLVKVYAEDRRPQLRTDLQGKADIVVDSYGRKLETEFRIEPVNGGELDLTIDVPLQAHAEKLLESLTGAIVVLNADTGEVLAMASSPNYDPSVFATRGRGRERQELLTDKEKPMRSRAYREIYPPGSVFKIMLATAALEEGVIDENTSFYCPGVFRLAPGVRPWRCHASGGHGTLSVVDALAYSCDVFFYNVGLKLGVDKINLWCDQNHMCLGQLTGIDLPQEQAGLIPSPEWKKRQHPTDPSEQKWYPGETVNLSIGQGSAAVTPLQTAVMTACVINDGRRVRPYVNQAQGPRISEPFISQKTLDIVRAGMFKCVDDTIPPSGTGRLAKIEGLETLGKTGTAQVAAMSNYSHLDENLIPYKLRSHAWFVCGVMNKSPRVVISVLAEHALHGSSGAAPIAKEMLLFMYRGKEQPDLRQIAQGEAVQ
jgi:penicillin-binding protein 2